MPPQRPLGAALQGQRRGILGLRLLAQVVDHLLVLLGGRREQLVSALLVRGRLLQRLHGLLSALWDAVEAGLDEGLSDFEMLPQVSEALAAARRSGAEAAQSLESIRWSICRSSRNSGILSSTTKSATTTNTPRLLNSLLPPNRL